ncbi:hypothetical protein LX36DRAFT_79088 [Colletotrichum falcatum]|nr:hypothetical protein LX36DRAFT_79088 [Colletotrichum falcatum]
MSASVGERLCRRVPAPPIRLSSRPCGSICATAPSIVLKTEKGFVQPAAPSGPHAGGRCICASASTPGRDCLLLARPPDDHGRPGLRVGRSVPGSRAHKPPRTVQPARMLHEHDVVWTTLPSRLDLVADRPPVERCATPSGLVSRARQTPAQNTKSLKHPVAGATPGHMAAIRRARPASLSDAHAVGFRSRDRKTCLTTTPCCDTCLARAGPSEPKRAMDGIVNGVLPIFRAKRRGTRRDGRIISPLPGPKTVAAATTPQAGPPERRAGRRERGHADKRRRWDDIRRGTVAKGGYRWTHWKRDREMMDYF